MIEFQNIGKEFRHKGKKVTALQDVTLEIGKGDIYGVIGYSGAGKSTLLRMVNALETPTNGKVIVKDKELGQLHNQELAQVKKNISMIFQHFNLLESKTVFDNIALPLILNKEDKKSIQTKVRKFLDFVGLADKENSYPNQLSGGQKQRVGIARALVTNPEILLCDEATSALDPKTTLAILELLKRVNEEFDITILIVTHEMEVIQRICNKVAVMENGEVIESGEVIDVFGNPQQKTTKGFVQTVIPDQIPEGTLQELKASTRNKKVYQLKFSGEHSSQSFLFELTKEFEVELRIVFANVTELQGTTLSMFTIAFYGEETEINRAIQAMKTNDITMKEVEL